MEIWYLFSSSINPISICITFHHKFHWKQNQIKIRINWEHRISIIILNVMLKGSKIQSIYFTKMFQVYTLIWLLFTWYMNSTFFFFILRKLIADWKWIWKVVLSHSLNRKHVYWQQFYFSLHRFYPYIATYILWYCNNWKIQCFVAAENFEIYFFRWFVR